MTTTPPAAGCRRVNANQLPPRYLLFYVALVKQLGLDDLLTFGVEQRRELEPTYMTRQEATWLIEHGALATGSLQNPPTDLEQPANP